MINFYYELDFKLIEENHYYKWLLKAIKSEKKEAGELNYIFCDDHYLLEINNKYLDHNTYTDIISFDYSEGKILQGDIFISIERVQENSIKFNTTFEDEIKRVMIHGILHYCGYKDKTDEDAKIMRLKENEKISMFHVEQ